MLHTGGRLSHFLDSKTTYGARSSYYSWHTCQPSKAEWTRRFSFVRKNVNLLWCPTLWRFRQRIPLGASGGVFKLPTCFILFPHSTTLVVSFSHTPPVTNPHFFFFEKNALLPYLLPRRCSCTCDSVLCNSRRRCWPRPCRRCLCSRCDGDFPPCQERRVSSRPLQHLSLQRSRYRC